MPALAGVDERVAAAKRKVDAADWTKRERRVTTSVSSSLFVACRRVKLGVVRDVETVENAAVSASRHAPINAVDTTLWTMMYVWKRCENVNEGCAWVYGGNQ